VGEIPWKFDSSREHICLELDFGLQGLAFFVSGSALYNTIITVTAFQLSVKIKLKFNIKTSVLGNQ
jgi:hypothetical protein